MPRRLKPLPTLEGDQKKAASPAHHAALSASAGTGKTQVLTARVFRLLLSGADPASILCLTFTKAGAAEMADRIHARLAYWVRLDEAKLRKELFALGERNDPVMVERARSLFARVLEAPGGGLRIQTIHAFAQGLLAAFPAEAGVTPGFRPMEEREEALLARNTLADLLVRAEQAGDLPLRTDLRALSLRLGEGDTVSLLRACGRVPEAMANLGPREGIEARLRHLFDLPLGDIDAAVLDECSGFDIAPLQRMAEAHRAWGTSTGATAAELLAGWCDADTAERAARLEALAGLFRTGKGERRKVQAGLIKVAPDYEALAQELDTCCQRLLTMRRTAAGVAMMAAGMRAGQTFAIAYADAKRAAGLVDFDDLIRGAERLLSTPGVAEWVRYKLDQRTDHVLVDEAQDTNEAQWQIVEALAGEFFAGQGAGGGHRTLFTVGDFKQAIFSFQGTDPAEFEKARGHFQKMARDARENAQDLFGTAERLPPDFLDLSMDRSFRSAPPVLAAVDQVLTDLGPEAAGLPRPARVHESHHATRPGSVTLWRAFSAEDEGEEERGEEPGEEGWLPDTVRLYAGRLAQQIAGWLRDPFRIEEEGRPLRPEDILILVRRRGALAALIVARLHAEGVPVAGIDRLSLSAPLAVKDLLAAARFALQPLDDLNLASLLMSPLMGWTQDDLFDAAFDRGGLPLWSRLRARAAVGQGPDLEPLLDMLGIVDFTTPHGFFEHLLSGPLAGRRKLLERLGAEARDPIEELLSSALDFDANGTPSLARFLDWFARDEVEIVRDPSAPLDAVRVMTVHGAKGLEAPVVILADACADPDRMGPGRRFARLGEAPVPRPRKEELAEPLASAIELQERRDRQEHWRLLYVAMTRAKERLYVGGALGQRDKVPAEESWFAAIERALGGLGGGWAEDGCWGAALRFGDSERKEKESHPQPLYEVVDGSLVTSPLQPLLEGSGVAISLLPSWLTMPAPQEERPPRPLAPSNVGGDEAAYPPPSPDQRRAAVRGRLLHRLFERLPDVPPADRRARADAWLRQTGEAPEPDFRAALIDDACRIIDHPRHAALFAPDALAEAPIAAVIAGGQVLSGTADRLLVGEDEVIVADFKTGRQVPDIGEAAPPSHLRQMAAYRAALNVIFPGRTVRALLLYTAGPRLLELSPDLLDAHAPVTA